VPLMIVNVFSMSKLFGKGLKIMETILVLLEGKVKITVYLASCLIHLTRAKMAASLVCVSREYVNVMTKCF